MDQIETYIALLAIIIAVGVVFSKTPIPTALLLVITGMLLSLIPGFPRIALKPDLVLEVFLPLILYATSADFSWREMRPNLRPIALLSIGHVLFITLIVAVTIHYFIPELGWPLAFVLGAVISPPDDVAIVAIAEKIHMPKRIVTILKGEGMFNDATALILYRFSLAALVTHQFSAMTAMSTYVFILIGETLYGLLLGHIIGEMRLRVREPILQMMISLLTPFLAYLPPERLGGSGVLATVVAGIYIGQNYLDRISPDARLISRSVWGSLGFVVQSLLFLLVGLDFNNILERIAYEPSHELLFYSVMIVLVVIIGRYIWVYMATYIPRWLFPAIRKKDPYPSWQHPFIISWAGMRGGISLAAALSLPFLAPLDGITSPRDLIVFFVFCVITATLVLQGLALPWLLQIIGIQKQGEHEKHHEHLAELSNRLEIAKAVLHWLNEYKDGTKDDPKVLDEVKFHIHEYQTLQKQLTDMINNHDHYFEEDIPDLNKPIYLSLRIIEIERKELARLWRERKINLMQRNKLLQQLDYRSKQLLG